jgi:hypothetical protein
MMLQTMLTGRKVHAPEALLREYRDTLEPYVLPPETELETPEPPGASPAG